ncbi:hypothetical protein BDV36DRAFT_258053 [Aspergillus pseudocaelatus]|uniref:DUF4045 domain-containing protein n=1 Tax=Aspergillus pseudocaelatus TaxID=1825620 RepID=A0ABQ6WIR8_9EURO|nr:hypothetical protein BDV36DRAFT_258053 [Aspergillus pseudocaelatus]
MDQSTRPRRPSLTRHLQRILHIDGHGNRNSSNSQVSSDAGLTASPQQQRFTQQRAQEPQSYLDVNEKPSHTHTRNPTSYSYTSLGSRHTPVDGEHPERVLKSSAHGISFQKQASCTPEETPTKSDIYISPTRTSNSALRNERRATLRLEAERVELEKKLMKLEQAESAKDSGSMRREPRRLTKKQPFSSSRASSVSADEPRTPRRISSIFSSSRRSSRSRSSSLNEDDKGVLRPQSLGPEGTPKFDHSTQAATRTLSTTLPERLSTAISKELAVQSNPLLANHTSSLRSQKLSYSEGAMAVGQGTESNKSFDKIEAGTSHVQGPKKLRHEPTEQVAPISMSISHIQQVSDPSELDRSSFAAALNLRKRISDKAQLHGRPSQPTHFQSNTTQEENQHELGANGFSRKTSASVIPLSTNHPGVRKSLISFQLGSSRSVPVRTPRGKTQGRHKDFTSSPLAGFSTTKNAAFQPLGAVPTEQASASFDGLCHTEPSAFSKMNSSSNTNPPLPMTSLRLSNEDGREHRHIPSSSLGFTSISKERPRTRVPNSSWLSDHSPKPHSSPAIPNAKPKGLSAFNQGVQHAFGPVKSHDQASPGNALENHSQSRSARSGSQDWGIAAQTGLEGGNISIYSCDFDSSGRGEPSLPKGGSTGALDYRIRRSTVSLSASLSQDPESEEYNTADEAASIASKAQSEESIPVKQLDIASVPAGLSSFSNNGSPFGLHHASQAVHPDTPALRTEQVGENSKQLRRGQLVAKLFVICCNCEFWHDVPSEIYAKLAFPASPSAPASYSPASVVGRSRLDDQALSKAQIGAVSGSPIQLSNEKLASPRNISASQTTARFPSPVVPCCWCEHDMSRVCCQGWSTVVDLRERHH